MRIGAWLNLLLPGGGLVLIGCVTSGLLVGMAFTLCANFALAAILLFPDDYSHEVHCLLIGLAGGCYVGAQLRYAQTVRAVQARAAAERRRRALWEARQLIEQGEYGRALNVISPLAREQPHDVLVAYRMAQALTEAGTAHAARIAWKRVRVLDRHGIYKQQIAAYERRLTAADAARRGE